MASCFSQTRCDSEIDIESGFDLTRLVGTGSISIEYTNNPDILVTIELYDHRRHSSTHPSTNPYPHPVAHHFRRWIHLARGVLQLVLFGRGGRQLDRSSVCAFSAGDGRAASGHSGRG